MLQTVATASENGMHAYNAQSDGYEIPIMMDLGWMLDWIWNEKPFHISSYRHGG
jgi:hypothetical protein